MLILPSPQYSPVRIVAVASVFYFVTRFFKNIITSRNYFRNIFVIKFRIRNLRRSFVSSILSFTPVASRKLGF